MPDARPADASNLDLIRRGFEAFARADTDALKAIFAEDAHYRHAPYGAFAGNYRGRDAIMSFFAQLARESDSTLRTEPLAMAESGDRVFVLYRASATRRGRVLDTRQILLFTLAEGLVTGADIFSGDHPALLTFWA